jgi:ComF family protein
MILTPATLRRHLKSGLDLLLPPQCLSCGGIVADEAGLCAECWDKIGFLGPPACPKCGFPFEFDMGDDVLCGACLRSPPVFGRCRAAFRYDDHSRKLILDLKYRDRTFLAPALARLLFQAGQELFQAVDVIVPVPLHRWRLVRRRFNQSALLAAELGKLSGKTVFADTLLRHRATRRQGGLNRNARRRNVRGAFRIRPAARRQIEGRMVLLIDDVMTTGATVDATARCLLRSGAANVDVLTLARVVRPAYD